MKKITYITLCLLGFLCQFNIEIIAQVAINADGSTPDPNAILDLKSTNKAFLPPRMTIDQIKAIPSPTKGMLAFDNDYNCLRMYTGTEWQCLQGANKELADPPGDFSILSTAASGLFFPNGVVNDALGNAYIVGTFSSPTLTLGSITLTNSEGSGTQDVFVVKYNSTGVVQWATKVGGTDLDFARRIAVDGSGNVYIVGHFRGPTITIGAVTLTNANSGTREIFVAKYNSSGIVQWAISNSGNANDYAQGIAVDGSGNVYIAGTYNSPSLNFGGTSLSNTSTTGVYDVYIAKYNTNGVIQWAVKGTSVTGGGNGSIAVDGSGNVYVAGYFFSNTVNFSFPVGNLTNANAGTSDVFVVKYNTNGLIQWGIRNGGIGDDIVTGIAADVSGNVYITGNFNSSTLAFGSTNLTNNSSSPITTDIFVAKYNTGGVVQWANKGGGTDNDYPNDLAVDGSGNVYITGAFNSITTSFGALTLTNTGIANADAFVVKYDTNGNSQWAVKGGGNSSDIGWCITVNTSGTRVLTGCSYVPNAKFSNTRLTTGQYLLWQYGE
jgi:hypothetical protein